MKSIVPALCLASICVLATSCSPAFDYTGKWIGFRDLKARPGENPEILRTLAKIELTLKPNGYFELIEAGMPFEGAYREFGGKAYLRIDSVLRRPIEESGYADMAKQEIELTPKKDGSIDFFDPAGHDGKPINLKRQPKP